MISILAKDVDPHADTVILALRERGFRDVLRLDLEEVLARHPLTIRYPRDGEAWSTVGLDLPETSSSPALRAMHRLSDGDTFWWRRHTYHLAEGPWLLPEPEALDRIEASWAARWLVESLDRGRFPLGHPEVLRHGSNKVRQLAVAREVGFRIPDTIISTEPEALLQFCGHHDVVVVKAVKTLLVLPKDESRAAETRVLGSRSVPSSELVPLIEDSPATSLFIQEHIDKKFDVRVNVLPNGSVACLIHLDLLPPGAIDWRPQTMELDHEIIEFPEHLDRLCRDYLAKLGLSWGAFDFGLTRDGEWVFFECNPNGQWLWIEIKTGYPLSARFAETLLEHHGRGSR